MGILKTFSYIFLGIETMANTVCKNIGNLVRRIMFALSLLI